MTITRIATAIAAVAGLSAVAAAQSATAKIPIKSLSAPLARTSASLGKVFVRELPGHKLLADDAEHHQVLLFDSTLTTSTVVIDSTPGARNSYGPNPAPIIPYLGDSTLFVDNVSQSLVVIDPQGKIARIMAAPQPQNLQFLGQSGAYTDNRGRLLYRGPVNIIRNNIGDGPKAAQPVQVPDSASLIRADFDTRAVDTIGKVRVQGGSKIQMNRGTDGNYQPTVTINPLPTVDEWSVLADGSVALVRGQDYHVDWIGSDGKQYSTPKMPFDWRRLSDEDKQHLIDSARTAREAAQAKAAEAAKDPATAAKAAAEGAMVVRMQVGSAGGDGVRSLGGDGAPGGPVRVAAPKVEYTPIKEIADYYPPILSGAAKADADGNLWILPTTTAQSQHGELVYDVVNNKGELYQRVRLSAGRSIAGFGKGGIVYLMGVENGKWYVERTRIVGDSHATQSQ